MKNYSNALHDLDEKRFTQQQFFKIRDKYDVEINKIKTELNLWKHSFIEIAKYQLTTYNHSNIEQFVNIDKTFIINASKAAKERIETIVSYFKSIID